MLKKYAEDNGFRNIVFFVDDGYSGTNFNRPDWIRLTGLIDEGRVATIIVKDIFKMCVEGKGPSQIAKALMGQGIPTPTEHYAALGIKVPARKSEQAGFWQQRTIADILSKQEYLGHIVNFKTRKKSFKCKKKINNDPSEWVIFKNAHEPIVDKETFDIV